MYAVNKLAEMGSLKIDNKLGEIIFIAGVAYVLYSYGKSLQDKENKKASANFNFDFKVSSEAEKAMQSFM